MADLVGHLKRHRYLMSSVVEQTMLAIDRRDFCPYRPYTDSPQSIGFAATISAPHMHAIALELLKDHLLSGHRVLDVGSGSGYLSACFARMVGPTGKVVGIDHIEQLVNISRENVLKSHAEFINDRRLLFVHGDGRLGYASLSPYDAIHVGAAAAIMPESLKQQLKRGGRMVIPIGTSFQKFRQIDKKENGELESTDLFNVLYVPLTDRKKQWSAEKRHKRADG